MKKYQKNKNLKKENIKIITEGPQKNAIFLRKKNILSNCSVGTYLLSKLIKNKKRNLLYNLLLYKLN